MPTKKNKVKVSELKGLKLYNFLVKELGESNKSLPNSQRIGIARRRKIVSEELYPKFKARPKVLLRDIRTDIRKVIKSLPPKDGRRLFV